MESPPFRPQHAHNSVSRIGEPFLIALVTVLLGLVAVYLAAEISTLETRFVGAFLGGIGVLFACLILRDHRRLFYFFLALFVMGIPFNLSLKFFYRNYHLGGAMGIDLSLSFICASFLYGILLYEHYLEPETGRIRYNKTLVWTQIAFMVAGVMTLVNAHDKELVFFEMVKLTVLFFFSLLMMNLRDERQLRAVIFFLSLGVLTQALFALYQYKTGQSLGLRVFGEKPLVEQYLGFTASRATGTIGHPNILAYYFEILLPLMFSLLLVEERKLTQLWYLLVIILGVGGMLVTLSRAGWITVPMSFFAVFVILVKDRWRQWRTVFEVFFGVVCLCIFLYYFFPIIEKRYLYEDYGSAATRIPLNRAALSIIAQFPLLGVGLNNLAEVFRRYDTTGAAMMITGSAPHVVHNLYLSVWTDVGTVGFLTFIVFLISIFLVGWRLLARLSRWKRGVLVGIMAGLLAHLFHGLVDPGFKSTLNISYLFYVLIGLIGGMGIIEERERAKENLNNEFDVPTTYPVSRGLTPRGGGRQSRSSLG